MLYFLKYFGYGWLILGIAILANALAKALGVTTWYDYIAKISNFGLLSATTALHVTDVLFLFFVYPTILGLIVWLAVILSRLK